MDEPWTTHSRCSGCNSINAIGGETRSVHSKVSMGCCCRIAFLQSAVRIRVAVSNRVSVHPAFEWLTWLVISCTVGSSIGSSNEGFEVTFWWKSNNQPPTAYLKMIFKWPQLLIGLSESAETWTVADPNIDEPTVQSAPCWSRYFLRWNNFSLVTFQHRQWKVATWCTSIEVHLLLFRYLTQVTVRSQFEHSLITLAPLGYWLEKDFTEALNSTSCSQQSHQQWWISCY